MLFELILDHKKCLNQKMLESESAQFLVWALKKVQNRFLMHFLLIVHNYCSEKKLGAFCLEKMAFQKLDFSFDFQKVI